MDTLVDLSERELEVLALMADGRSNQAIAAELHVTVKTVECHIHRIFGKLVVDPGPAVHRRVVAVLAYLRQQDLVAA